MWTWMIVLVLAILMIGCYSRFKKPGRAVMFGAGSGLLAFGVVGYFTTGWLTFTWFQILLALIAGIPGVLTAILLQQFFVL